MRLQSFQNETTIVPHFVCQTIPFILVNNRSKRHNENHPIVAFGTEPGPSFLHSSHGGDEVEPGTDQEI